MKPTPPSTSVRSAACLGAILCWLILVIHVSAQSSAADPSPPASDAPTPPKDSVVKLTPFEVQAAADKSYGALNSNSITSFNTSLDKLAISADIFNSQFMEDTASQTVESMIETYYAGAGAASAVGDPSGSTTTMPLDRGNVYNGVQLRGLGSTVTKQDGFMVPIPTGTNLTSNFSIERVEVINGPQSLLYGNGGAGGVINLISKQARLGEPTKGSLKFQVDQYGDKTGELDYGAGSANVAIRLAVVNQQLGSYREYIGGDMQGYYLQAAVSVLGNTVIRVTGQHATFARIIPQYPTLATGGSAIDVRTGQAAQYLLATNQVAASATGASGAGPILNGNLNWSNVDSFLGATHSEISKLDFGQITAETVWNSWLSSQFAVGYQNHTDEYGNPALTFDAPTVTTNPVPGTWSASLASGDAYINQEPGRVKAIRYSVLATNDLFGGRAHSQTILGADFSRSDVANIAYGYYQADSNWNPIINSAVTANNGRTFLPTVGWSLNNGPVKYPIWPIGTPRLTVNGNNYVLMLYNQVNPSVISPTNPEGITLGGQYYLQSEVLNRGYYSMNYTQWMDGKLTTTIGARYAGAYYKLDNQGGRQVGDSNDVSLMAGANYELLPWLRPYVTVSDSYNPPVVLLDPNPTDPYGRQLALSKSFGEEAGVKIGRDNAVVSGYLAVYHVQSQNEQYLISSTLVADINPTGLNGTAGTPGIYISVDRQSIGAQAAVTAVPSPNWRLQLSAALIKGTIGNSTSYQQLYNDQFNENSQGQVTYADGTVVYVAPTFNSKAPTVSSTAAGAVPLTVAMMSSSSSPYYANPVATTGQILGSSAAGVVLKTVDPVHGAILTGKTGLPISALQIDPGFTPPGTIVTSEAGDSTTGYPELSLNATSVYTFSSGWGKGLKLGGTIGLGWKRADYYYYTSTYKPTVPRALLDLPTLARFDGIVGYERKLRRVTLATQLNINNLFNRYHVVILPNAINGYGGIDNATFDQAPRSYLWTNTINF